MPNFPHTPYHECNCFDSLLFSIDHWWREDFLFLDWSRFQYSIDRATFNAVHSAFIWFQRGETQPKLFQIPRQALNYWNPIVDERTSFFIES